MVTKRWNGGTVTGDAGVIDSVIDELELARARTAATIERWGSGDDPAARMGRLCASFPSLRGVPGSDPWDAMQLLTWVCSSGAVTTGGRLAAQFVLQVWNPTTDWGAQARRILEIEDAELRPFNVVVALARWDDDHERAFRRWAELPFWP
ncbi:MAG: hypothetical protein OXU20_06935 [Myxococcales bacterium]|nr:hypothetical protein [Myxococcales bacterium]MDD9965617.1 hypothetical protein [Myxococcales bacterium]